MEVGVFDRVKSVIVRLRFFVGGVVGFGKSVRGKMKEDDEKIKSGASIKEIKKILVGKNKK